MNGTEITQTVVHSGSIIHLQWTVTLFALVGSEGRDVTLGRVGGCQTSIAFAKLLCPLTIREILDFVLVLVATGTDFVHFCVPKSDAQKV